MYNASSLATACSYLPSCLVGGAAVGQTDLLEPDVLAGAVTLGQLQGVLAVLQRLQEALA